MIIRRSLTSLFATNANSLPIWEEVEPNVYRKKRYNMDFIKKFEELSAFALSVSKKEGEAFRVGVIETYMRWQKISNKYLDLIEKQQFLDLYTNLDWAPNDASAKTYFMEFYETLYTHTDRMWANPWVRCQLYLANAYDKAVTETEEV